MYKTNILAAKESTKEVFNFYPDIVLPNRAMSNGNIFLRTDMQNQLLKLPFTVRQQSVVLEKRVVIRKRQS